MNLRQLHRLVTHEDAAFLHLHKLAGVLCLGHFAWRASSQAAMRAMNADPYLPLWIALHALLHLTSFQFVLAARRNKAYTIIWPEMRWHTLIFAFRALVAMAFQWLANTGRLDQTVVDVTKGPTVLAALLCADLVTAHYKRVGQVDRADSTMRGNVWPDYVPTWYVRRHNLFYSVSQVFATVIMLTQRDVPSIFLTLVPIQTAPLFMTLAKKGIIGVGAWHVLYTFTLLTNYAYNLGPKLPAITTSTQYLAMVLAFSVGRFALGANKYLLWGLAIAGQLASVFWFV